MKEKLEKITPFLSCEVGDVDGWHDKAIWWWLSGFMIVPKPSAFNGLSCLYMQQTRGIETETDSLTTATGRSITSLLIN